jgi:HTH-type transcriptional regulator / antitoxin HipB
MKKQIKTIHLEEFSKNFSPDQKKIVEEEMKYYDLLTSFKEAREKSGMTQDELAKKANINRVTLSKIESGLRNATISTLDKLATALNMRLHVTLRVS